MLYTRCPECRTTFRITEAILQKADGQVRCGRCAHIFDARLGLREEAGRALAAQAGRVEDEAPAEAATAHEAAAASRIELAPAAASSVETSVARSSARTARLDVAPAAARHAETHVPGDHAPAAAPHASPDWLPELTTPTPRKRFWSAGAGALAVVLLAQVVHHFRADIAGLAGLGPAVVAAYSVLGVDVSPRIDLAQYEILESAAIAEPGTNEPGRLIIETRFQNRGPRVQPYPFIFVSLEDRWQETIAGRYFAPDEYLRTPIGDASRMSVGRVVEAEFVIVDPGPDASGFALDVCAPRSGGFTCKEDAVFE